MAIAAISWTLFAGWGRDARPGPNSLLLAGVATVYSLCRVTGARWPWLVPAALTCIVAGVAARNPQIASGHPLAAPLGYANANAALLVQATVAAGCWLMLVRRRIGRLTAAVLGSALAATTLATGSRAGTALAAAAIVVTLMTLRWPIPAPVAVLVAAATATAAVLVTIALGAGARDMKDAPAVDRAVEEALSSRRPVLWSDALSATADEPLRGVGPGRFEVVSPIARIDRDARWAHSLLLQQAAETGVPGALLLALLVGVAFSQLWRSAGGVRLRGLAAFSLAAFLVHASIDYVAHFAAVSLAVAALTGSAAALTIRRDV